MVYRIVILLILFMYPFDSSGTSDNTHPTPTSNDSGFPTLQITDGHTLSAATPPDGQEQSPEEITKLSPSQIEVIERVRATINRRDRTILIKSVVICVVGGIAMFAIGRLK